MSNTDAHGATAENGGGPQPPTPVTIAFVLYPGFTALDIIGPFQALAYVPGHEAVFVAAQPGPVTDDTGLYRSKTRHVLPDLRVRGGSVRPSV
jgi:hypothetical protein